jgi:hypothetical protein
MTTARIKIDPLDVAEKALIVENQTDALDRLHGTRVEIAPAPIIPTADDAARAEAERIYPFGTDGMDDQQRVQQVMYVHGQREGYVRGRTDERAQIAARRDEVPHRPGFYHCDTHCGGPHQPETVTTAAELDALPVGSVVAWFWPDGSGPTVHWHDAEDGWTNGDVRRIRYTDPLDAATVLHRGGDQ